MSGSKHSILSFKADESIVQALKGVSNRSSFIRSAILAALDNACPLCLGTGFLNKEQRKHWDAISGDHSIEECDDCHERYLVCSHNGTTKTH